MRVEGLQFDIPELAYNPFSTSPLESNQSDLYVGRRGVRGRISQNITFRSNRSILMVGELGSGRTSLLRCAGAEASVYVHIDHISPSRPGESLLHRMYSSLVGYDIPENSVELVNKMVDFSRSFKHKLPLIVIDTPNVEGSVLSVALRDVLPSLERLQAVIVVVVEPKQRMNIPDYLLNTFANEVSINSLTVDEVQELVERRILSVTNKAFNLKFEDAKVIHQKTAGVPIKIVKFMRDAIDNMMMKNDGIEDLINHYSQDSEPNLVEKVEYEKEVIDYIESVTPDQSIIDASLPWDERDELDDLTSQMETINPFGFELDLDELSESQQFDEDVQEHTFSAFPSNDDTITETVKQRPYINAGPFGGLLGRTRDFDDKEKSAPEVMVNEMETQGAELWVSKDLVEIEEKIEFSAEESAELIHDEIGIDVSEEFFELPESHNIPENNGSDTDQNLGVLSNQIAVLLASLVTNNTVGDISDTSSNRFVSALMDLSNQNFSAKTDYPLDSLALSSLNSNESYVLSIARLRKYSPSDKEILSNLEIKRPRLSQISNKLLKSGILNVRMKGRSRYFELTQAAKAQLIAWGVIGGDE
jgi:tetrahydromethanopterin S-methyltransferase subunit G